MVRAYSSVAVVLQDIDSSALRLLRLQSASFRFCSASLTVASLLIPLKYCSCLIIFLAFLFSATKHRGRPLQKLNTD